MRLKLFGKMVLFNLRGLQSNYYGSVGGGMRIVVWASACDFCVDVNDTCQRRVGWGVVRLVL